MREREQNKQISKADNVQRKKIMNGKQSIWGIWK